MRLALAIVLVGGAAHADPPETAPTPFDGGHFAIGIGGSESTNFGYTYVALGASVAYYLIDGVSVGVSGTYELGSGPSIEVVSPQLRYVAQPLVGRWPVVPYVGAFYAHYFLGGDYSDEDSVGASAGGMWVSGRTVLGLGVAVEHLVSTCMTDCTQVYPDITIGLAF